MPKINYLFLALLLVNFYGMQEDKLNPELPILSKEETIKNFLFDEFHKGLGVGLVCAGFLYGSIGMLSYKSPFFKEIRKNKKLINALTLIAAVLPTVKNFYAYRKFTIGEDHLFNQLNQLDESYYLSPDPLKVLAMRTLKLKAEDTYVFIFALLEKLSFKAVKNMRNNMNKKAFFQANTAEINEIFKAAINEHFKCIVNSLQFKSKVNQEDDYDSVIKFFLLDIDNMEKNSEDINTLISSFKAKHYGENFQYHTFEEIIIKMIEERKNLLIVKNVLICVFCFLVINGIFFLNLLFYLFYLLSFYQSTKKKEIVN